MWVRLEIIDGQVAGVVRRSVCISYVEGKKKVRLFWEIAVYCYVIRVSKFFKSCGHQLGGESSM
jgi:hypothetical protein